MIANPDQLKNAPSAVFRQDPTLDRTHTEEMNIYERSERVCMESVHGVKQWVRVSINDLPLVKTDYVS